MTSFTFVTCVADPETYRACRHSLSSLGTGRREAVVVAPVDNRSNRWSCPEALNRGWQEASTDYLVFCHQDVAFPPDWLDRLEREMDAVAVRDPCWAVLGPMGRRGKTFLGHDFDAAGNETFHGPLPAPADTVDEYCLVVRRTLPLRFDESLGGFHLYGVDLCIQAVEAGYSVWAVDAPCTHLSPTRHRPRAYHEVKLRLQRKWRFRRRRVGACIGTTCGRIRFGLFEGWRAR